MKPDQHAIRSPLHWLDPGRVAMMLSLRWRTLRHLVLERRHANVDRLFNAVEAPTQTTVCLTAPEAAGPPATLGSLFAGMLRETLPGVAFSETTTTTHTIVVPARHPEVGELVVCDDGHQLTVSVGALTRSCYSARAARSVPAADARKAAARAAVSYVAELLADRRLIRIRLAHGAIAADYDLPRQYVTDSPRPNERDFLWSGPVNGDVETPARYAARA